MDLLALVCQEVERGQTVALVTVIGPAAMGRWLGCKVAVGPGGTVLGHDPLPAGLGTAMAEVGAQVLAGDEPRAVDLPVSEVSGGKVRLYAEPYHPLPELVIAGAGHVGQALAALAHLAGFAVTVVDDRPEYASPERFPPGVKVVAGTFVTTLAGLDLGPRHFVVLATRAHDLDLDCLRVVIRRPVTYVGMIGSRHRVETVFRLLEEEGVPPDSLSRVYAPIGLDIGARTPAEIAVSILAEVVRVRRGGTGEHLSRLRRPLVHDARKRGDRRGA